MPGPEELEQRIRERAFQLWKNDGEPEGRESEHWEKARAEIEAERDGATASPECPAGS